MTLHPLRPMLWISLLALAGCTTDREALLPPGEQDIRGVWSSLAGGGALSEARLALRRPLEASPEAVQTPYSRTAANEIRRLFPRLPNPDLVLYVYPHLAGSEQAPVPGYSTVLPFYRTVHYALPGERLDDY